MLSRISCFSGPFSRRCGAACWSQACLHQSKTWPFWQYNSMCLSVAKCRQIHPMHTQCWSLLFHSCQTDRILPLKAKIRRQKQFLLALTCPPKSAQAVAKALRRPMLCICKQYNCNQLHNVLHSKKTCTHTLLATPQGPTSIVQWEMLW